ncbi:uncharacterized protein MELLADRAFT_87096 [Melampsora larici-populina 98AG31]|uniref:Peroxisome assembly protein 12 n=1 Tax=Melampsora larici-populina (strain 98AG31 / pathotype 3-4-7) TaxID=747676 RepID=F4R4H5_MELLP|nr:uncharacterized protein MELLADRAFT_87096 [Melampsora larici-populina 98AG31]EGG13001.1 hypothetical protein MELLADRAFT_87096 [Melampsora larici-populina 98AG31]
MNILTLEDDPYRPNFFELIAQDQLRDLLSPVTRYVLSVFAQSHPRYLLRIVNRHDECFALLMLFIERYYLKNWGGSFAEHFYGLKRRRRLDSNPIEPRILLNQTNDHGDLRTKHIRYSLFCLVGIPYLRKKARDLYERLGGSTDSTLLEDDSGMGLRVQQIDPNANQRQLFYHRISDIYKLLYPYTNAAYEAINLVYSLQYLLERSPYWRPFEAWMKLEIRRLSGQDYQRMGQKIASMAKSPFRRNQRTGARPSLLRLLLRIIQRGTNVTLESLKVALPCSIFAFKFLEWWYSPSNIRRTRTFGMSDEAQDLYIKPPVSLRPHPEGVLSKEGKLIPVRKGHCPICRSVLVNSTAFPSGWVCCYKCAHSYVSDFGRCPVTWYPTILADLRKIIG